MWSANGVCAILVALQASVFVSNSEPLVINYFDAPNSGPLNSSLMKLLHLEEFRKEIPAGFTNYGVGAYKFHKEPLTWGKAMKVCEGEGAHLAIINSQQEEDVLVSIFSKVPAVEIKGATGGTEHVSVGVHDHFNEGEYMTVQGKSLDTTGFIHWSPGEPNGGIKDNCVVMHRTGTLFDTSCAALWAYICELK